MEHAAWKQTTKRFLRFKNDGRACESKTFPKCGHASHFCVFFFISLRFYLIKDKLVLMLDCFFPSVQGMYVTVICQFDPMPNFTKRGPIVQSLLDIVRLLTM